MSTITYVGNLPFDATEEVVHGLCNAYGTVESVHLITECETGRPLTVTLAQPRAKRAPRPRRW